MNLAEFYDHVVLRDLLEYTAPGTVVLVGVASAFDMANFALTSDLAVAHFAVTHPWHSLVFLLFFGYVTGHILAAVHSRLFRDGEAKLVSDVLETREEKANDGFCSRVFNAIADVLRLGKKASEPAKSQGSSSVKDAVHDNTWLLSRVSNALEPLGIPQSEAENFLKDKKTASIARELCRAVVQLHLPDLYREYVNRHSILSRFCQNMAIGIAIALSVLALAWVVYLCSRFWSGLTPRHFLVFVSGLIVIFGGVCSVCALWARAARLRRTMARHTFELFYLDHVGIAKTAPRDLSTSPSES
jgi:hypothetical protein